MGGWVFEPWDETFYPARLPKSRQLEYASAQVPTIEVNGTYYSTFKPPTFAKWSADAPDGFKFSLKANRFATNRKVLGSAAESIERFLGSGVTELGDKLGPILWQFMATKKFEPEDFEAFLKLLPASRDGIPLRHALEPRHPSFAVPEFVALARKYGAAIVIADHAEYPQIADITADFVYARLQKGSDDNETCYAPAAMDDWAGRTAQWASGGQPKGLAYADPERKAVKEPRDVFVYFITQGKSRAPHGAMELMRRTG